MSDVHRWLHATVHYLDLHTGAITTVATIVLVLVTAWYSVLTGRIARATIDAQRAYLFIDFVPELGNGFTFVLANDGSRAAGDVTLRITSSTNEGVRAELEALAPAEGGDAT